jgi:hypothetical protein
MSHLTYLSHYNKETQEGVKQLIREQKLERYLLHKYPQAHTIKTDKALFTYVNTLKNIHMKKSAPLSKTLYDGKIHVINNALGTHRFISRVQGAKLKAKNEIRIASMFKSVPEAFLEMIVVHELAHFREKEHNKAFYQLCEHMQSTYHQREFDLRLYLTQMQIEGKIEQWQ